MYAPRTRNQLPTLRWLLFVEHWGQVDLSTVEQSVVIRNTASWFRVLLTAALVSPNNSEAETSQRRMGLKHSSSNGR